MEYEQLHPTKAHVRLGIFIAVVSLAVMYVLLVVTANISSGAGIFGLVVNTQLHSNVNSVMTHPKVLMHTSTPQYNNQVIC